MRRCDIVLISCPITFEYRLHVLGDQRYWPPLGLLYLGAVLEQRGVRVRILDPAVKNMALRDVIRVIEEDQPYVVGFSVLTPGLRTCLQMAEAVRNRFGNDMKLCIGGSHVSADPEFYQRFPVFDVAVTGEAEQTFADIALRLIKREDLKGIFQGKAIQDLDSIPLPARHLVKIEDYMCYRTKEIGLISTRGCPFHCSFCSRPAVSNEYRMRSSKNVVDEMEKFYKEGWDKFYFLDDILTLNQKHIIGLCEEILLRGLRIKWGGNTRADCIDGEIIAKMSEAGCKVLLYGVESGNARIRNEIIGKGVSDEKILDAIRMTNEKKIVSGMFLMMGFPTEGEDELKDTINISRKADSSIIGVHLTKPMPGAKIFYQGIQEGVIEKGVIDQYARGELGEGFVEKWPVYVPPGMTRKKLNNAKKKAMLLFYFRPKWIFKNAKRYFMNRRILWFDFKKAISILIRGQSKESMS